MIPRKEMRCWDHKALPTQLDDIHLASVPVDSKMLGSGALDSSHGSHLIADGEVMLMGLALAQA